MREHKRFDPQDAPWVFDAAQTRAFVKRLLATSGRMGEDEAWLDAPQDQQNARWLALTQGARFASRALEYVPDADHLPLHARLIWAVEHWAGDAEDSPRFIAECMGAALARAEEPGPTVERLARSPAGRVRRALAVGLRTDRPAHLALLRVLAEDAAPEVRAAARQRLARVETVLPWKGRFSRDPLEGLGPEESARVGAVISELGAMLDARIRRETGAGFLVALAKLPDALALDLLRTSLATLDLTDHFGVLLHALRGRDRIEDAVWDLCTQWVDRGEQWAYLSLLWDRFAKQLAQDAAGEDEEGAGAGEGEGEGDEQEDEGARLTPERRQEQARICEALAERMLAVPADERAREEGRNARAALVGTFLTRLWPSGADPTRLLDGLLAAELAPGETKLDPALTAVKSVVIAALGRGVPDALFARIERAHAEGYPGPWQRVATECRAMLRDLPPARARVVAQGILAREGASTEDLGWALEALSGGAYDEAHDPPRAELLRGWLATPALRAAVFAHDEVRPRALPLLREELVAGALTLADARRAASSVGRLWRGGGSDPLETDPEGAAECPAAGPLDESFVRHACEGRAKLGPWLTVGPRVGPLRDDEWTAVRALRDAPGALPPGPAPDGPEDGAYTQWGIERMVLMPDRTSRWTAEERAFADRWFTAVLARHEQQLDTNDYVSLLGLSLLLARADERSCADWFVRASGARPVHHAFVAYDYVGHYRAFCARTKTPVDPSLFVGTKRPDADAVPPDEAPSEGAGWGDEDHEDDDA